jgi:hypothetical protein
MMFNNTDIVMSEHRWRVEKSKRRMSSPTRRRVRRMRTEHPTDLTLGLTAEQVIADLGRPATNWL